MQQHECPDRRPRGDSPGSYPSMLGPAGVLHTVQGLMLSSPAIRVRAAQTRYSLRTHPLALIEPVSADDPIEQWLREVEDACFNAGRDQERIERLEGRPHRRARDLALRISMRLAHDTPFSRVSRFRRVDETKTRHRAHQ